MNDLFNKWQDKKGSERCIGENSTHSEDNSPLWNHYPYKQRYIRGKLNKNIHHSNFQEDVLAGRPKNSNYYTPQYVHNKIEKINTAISKPNENIESLRDHTKLDSPNYQSERKRHHKSIEKTRRLNEEDSESQLGIKKKKLLNLEYNRNRNPIILDNAPTNNKLIHFKTKRRDAKNDEDKLNKFLNLFHYKNRIINPYLNQNYLEKQRLLQDYCKKNNLSFSQSNEDYLPDAFFNIEAQKPHLKMYKHNEMANSSNQRSDYSQTFQSLNITPLDSVTIKTRYKLDKLNNTNIYADKIYLNKNVNGIIGSPKSSNNFQNGPTVKKCPSTTQKVSDCHPKGGEPKFHKENIVANPNDEQYNEVLRGVLTVRVVQSIINKALKNQKMRNTFGLCYKNISKASPNVLNKISSTTCTPLYGELKCFLKWLLAVDSTRVRRSQYYNVKPDRNFLFDQDFLNPWPRKGKREAIALPPSLYGFAKQIYRFGKHSYTSSILDQTLFDEKDMDNQLIYRSKIVLLPEDYD